MPGSLRCTLAPASQVVKGSDTSKLKYKLTNIQLEYEMIRSKTLADEAHSVYSSGKEFTHDHVSLSEAITFKNDTDTRLCMRVNSQRRSMKGISSFVEPYVKGTRDSEKYIFPDILYRTGIENRDIWEEVSRFLSKEKKTAYESENVFRRR